MDLDAILFDFDGVLVDSVHIKEKAFGVVYSEYGDEIVHKVMKYHRDHGGVSRFEKFRHYHKVFLGKELLLEEEEILNIKFSELVKQMVVHANEMPGAGQVLKLLYRQLPLHVISATPECELEEIIVSRKIRHFFHSVHGSPKKKSGHIVEIIKKQNYDKQKVIMVGDTLADYEAAQEAKVKFIGYVPQGSCNLFQNHISIITNLKDLLLFV